MRMNSEPGSASPKPSTAGASEEEFDPDVIQKMLIQIKCLNICRNMLERSEEVKEIMPMPWIFWNAKTNQSSCPVITRKLIHVWIAKRADHSICAK
jgi:hypothetical protein